MLRARRYLDVFEKDVWVSRADLVSDLLVGG
jgi:hypothetical protein